MKRFSISGFAVIFIMAASVCIASPRPDGRITNVIHKDSLNIPQWLRSAVKSVKQVVANKNVQGDSNNGFDNGNNKQDGTIKAAVDTLPVLIHKEHEESSIKVIQSSLSDTDKVNPFVRSKRSTCATPANLPQMVRDLNTRLTASQLVGLNPGESTPQAAPTSQYNTCPNNVSGDWWPRPEVNLRSTCPWTLQQVDLGVNAFPRYVNTAVCLCNNSCIGSPSMRCMEVTYDVTYFTRTGCENGLAVMEPSKYTVNIGCHCVGALRQTPITDHNSE